MTTAESVGLMLPAAVMKGPGTMLSVLQRENVKHGLLPFPFLRDTGRCRMLGIHAGGVRHPSSEGNTTANRNRSSGGPWCGCCWNLRCRIASAFVAWYSFVPLCCSIGPLPTRTPARQTPRLHHCQSNTRNRQFHLVRNSEPSNINHYRTLNHQQILEMKTDAPATAPAPVTLISMLTAPNAGECTFRGMEGASPE
jgi:hypothetical protein